MTHKVFLFSLYILSFLLIFKQIAFAQVEPFNITISPHAFTIAANPGDSIKNKILLRNNTDNPLQLKIELKKLVIGANDQTTIQDLPPHDEAYTFVSIASTTAAITALPKEWTTIPFSITIPKDANFGYDWAIIISPKINIPSKTTTVNGSVAIPLLLDVNKNHAIVTGSITKFITDKQWYEYLPTTFMTTFSSKSNVHIKPAGNIFITDWTGKQVGVIDINKSDGVILPNANRTFSSIWDNGFITQGSEATEGKQEAHMKIHFDKLLEFRIGKYNAHTFIVVNGPKKDISYEATTSFFVFPWKIISGGIVVIILVFIGVINTIRSAGKKIFSLLRVFQKKT